MDTLLAHRALRDIHRGGSGSFTALNAELAPTPQTPLHLAHLQGAATSGPEDFQHRGTVELSMRAAALEAEALNAPTLLMPPAEPARDVNAEVQELAMTFCPNQTDANETAETKAKSSVTVRLRSHSVSDSGETLVLSIDTIR